LEPLALTLAEQIRLAVPRACLAQEAFAVASGLPTAPRREGAPELPRGSSVAQAFAHVVGHLTDVVLYFAPLAAGGRDGPEPVHQMRVAVRRLRSAVKVFHRAVHCPAVDGADTGLKSLAKKLAPTRDWDVFVTETIASVTGPFADEPRLQRLLSAAERKRKGCHDSLREFLNSQEFRRLGIELACLAGGEAWQASLGEAEQAELAISLDAFAAHVLSKRLEKLVEVDDDLTALTPPELHAIRLNAKRLRYAAEIFEPLYTGKTAHRFIRRLSRLQDRLGTLNDAAVAANLLGELPGGSHAFAGGLVLGFLGAHGSDTREGIDKEWQKFRRLEPFWQ
jgi:CHAD domain-containing protein